MVPDREEVLTELTKVVDDGGVDHVLCSDCSTPPIPQACSLPWPRINFVKTGSLAVDCCMDGENIVLHQNAGWCFYYFPWAWNRHSKPTVSTVLSLVFKEGYIRYVWSETKKVDNKIVANHYWHHTNHPPSKTTHQVLSSLNDMAIAKGDSQTMCLLVNALFRLCLDELKRDSPLSTSKSTFTFQNTCAYLHEHFQEPINRDSVAEIIRISPNYLSRLFREHAGQTFNHYLRDLRLQKARMLLKDFRISVQEAAFMSGFNEVRHFIRTFKEAYGQSPGKWRT